MPESVALVVNPAAGRGRGPAAAGLVEPVLREAGLATHLVRGTDAADTVLQTRRALDGGIGSVAVIGGDGLLHALLPDLVRTGVPVGLVPAGTGNDIARLLDIPRRDPVAAARIIAAGHVRTIDLAQVGTRFVATVVAAGFDALVTERANAMTWPRGQMRYNLATLVELGVFRPLHYRLDLDGRRHDVPAMLVAVGNGPSYGGGLRICEGADPHDGLLDVVVIGPLSRPSLLRLFPRLSRGTHVTHPAYSHLRVHEVTISCDGVVAYGDGERLGALPLTVRAVPRALRVHVAAPP